MMRIGIDLRCLAQGRQTGVEEYTVQLLTKLFAKDTHNRYVLFFNAWKQTAVDLRWAERFAHVEVKRFHYPNKLLNFLLWYARWPHIDRLLGGVDLFFMPNSNFVALSEYTRLIVTVHDLSFEHYPRTFSWKRRLWHLFVNVRKLCRRADVLVAVSASTKRDLVATYGIAPQKIHHISSGLSDDLHIVDHNNVALVAAKEKYHLPYKFILYFGTIEPRKNIIGIIHAYNRLRSLAQERYDAYKLVIAGAAGWKTRNIFRAIAASPYRDDIIVTGFVPDDDKVLLYNLASLFVYPSHFEGFGFPVLEAMRCGVPVITSHTSSLPELVDDTAVMIDPDQPDQIYRAMRELLSHDTLRRTLSAKGAHRAALFSWDRAAEELLHLFESLT